MPDTPPKTNRRQSSLAMLLSVVLALVITAASFLAFIVWVTTNIDQRAVERQRTLVTHIIDGRQKSLLQQLESVAVWDDAVVNTQFRINFDWIADNLGVWMYDFYRIDRIAIFDKNAVPIYLMDAGVSLEPAEHPELTTVF
ncbi:MAG TPA: CHASE4 domain-containing protein, partial [Devosia sp.]|nr:CHASE4 domain-containing protein [Devosia sp.]